MLLEERPHISHSHQEGRHRRRLTYNQAAIRYAPFTLEFKRL